MHNAATVTVATPSDREITITREFAAPAQLVWDAHTRPELFKRWCSGPPGWTMPVCEIDLRVGGAWRTLMVGPDGQMGMHGVHLEIVPHQRISRTEMFEPAFYPGEAISTLTLVEHRGRTTTKVLVVYPSKEVRDMTLKSGMDEGMAAGYRALDTLLEELVAGAAS